MGQPGELRKLPSSPGTTGKYIQLAPGVEWRYEYVNDGLWGGTLFFYYFHGGTMLTMDQMRVVRNSLVPLLRQRASYTEIYGLADRTGSQWVNYKVSGDRLRNFQTVTKSSGGPPEKVFGPQHKYFGEDYAATRDVQDEMSLRDYRVVLAYVWSNFIASRRIFADLGFLQYARSTPQP
jgi:hypothetical protein